MSFKLIIPAAGAGSRFSKNGWKNPKPFIDLNNKPLLQHVIDNLGDSSENITVILQEKYKDYISLLENPDDLDIKYVNGLTDGTLCTVLDSLELEQDQPIVIANSDQLLNIDMKNFINNINNNDLDGSIVVFKDKTLNPKWSFAKINKYGHVTKVAEKDPISNLATVGVYYFKSFFDFKKYANKLISNNERVNNEFYVCPVYNYLIDAGGKVGVYEIDVSDMMALGTPEDFRMHVEKFDYEISKDDPNEKTNN